MGYRTTTYSYDALDQLIGVSDPTQGLSTWTYDRAFNRLTQATSDGLSTYSYDPANELTLLLDKTGRTTYSYDLTGNQRTLSNRLGVTTYSWDSQNRLVSTVQPTDTQGQTPVPLTYTYRYDDP